MLKYIARYLWFIQKDMTENRGTVTPAVLDNFFIQGWTKENLVDAISLVGDKTISN